MPIWLSMRIMNPSRARLGIVCSTAAIPMIGSAIDRRRVRSTPTGTAIKDAHRSEIRLILTCSHTRVQN
ncbi:hypothetical protein [uncultured Marinococcus sp.]|uniref:hypothetical protein n=1 Tax=uncultured Marinococcus sp. TaxID=487012 RepID=UPI003432CD78